MNPCPVLVQRVWSGFALTPAAFTSGLLFFATLAPAQTVHVSVPRVYLPQAAVIVRVELRNQAGHRDLNRWDANALLTIDPPAVTLSTNRILLRNGLGSALVRVTGAGNFTITATVDDVSASASVVDLSGTTSSAYGGTLPGSSTTWAGLVLVTNDVTVPAGHTLTIESNTLVLLNGVASGTTAPDILVQGTIQSLGTESHPVHITCASNHLNWGQIRHNTAQPALYRHTMITKGGRATGEGHTGTGPMIRPTSSRITFESCTISDATSLNGTTIGKIAQATGSDLTFSDCILARARMGPEITTTALLCSNTWISEMTGPDDSDGIYLHDAPGRQLLMTGCVIASGTDDAIDLLNAVVDIEGCIIRDWPNPGEDAKGISAFHGITRVRRCLFANCFVGIAAKSSGPQALVTVNDCTVTGIQSAVSAVFKSNATVGNVDYRLTNCIVRSVEAIHSDFAPTNFSVITYCNLSQPWAGVGNTIDDPLFVNEAANNYHLQPFSTCIDSGHPTTPADPDGSPADRGCFRFLPPAPTLGTPEPVADSIEFTLQAYTNRNYIIEFSSDFANWQELLTSWQSDTSVSISNSPPAEAQQGFYRARLAP
jgi:hypothetical protein